MSDIIDSIKQGANQILSNIDQEGHIKTAIDGLRSQLSEVERRRRINQMTSEIQTLQTESKQLTEALGLQTLSLYTTQRIDHPELAKLCERIEELHGAIAEKRAVLTELKAQAASAPSTCPKCGAKVAANSDYCPKCGAPSAPPQPTKTQSAAQPKVRLRCPQCKTIVPVGAGFCPGCGVKLKMPKTVSVQKHFCDACGAELSATAQFCPACGHAVPDQS